MSVRTLDFVVVGGGIVGLAVARELLGRHAGARLALFEKEPRLAFHQTGHNSGVIHSGVYYRPESLKARLCVEGRAALLEFCREHRIPHRLDGKLIVASGPEEVAALREIHRRGTANGAEGIAAVPGSDIRRYEPHVRGVEAVWVPTAGVVDYGQVSAALAEEVQRLGGQIRLGEAVQQIGRSDGSAVLRTVRDRFEVGQVISCAGLQSDRVAGALAREKGVRIIPFRGDYYRLTARAASLIRALVYPVPDSRFPFLGVHFARHVDGEVTAGPNAVLALSREGYGRLRFNARDAWDTLRWPGFWRLAASNWRKGVSELWTDFVKSAYAGQLRRIVPELAAEDLESGPCGVRAQAVLRDGKLVDDFLLVETPNALHVLNAPSPAATSSLAIAREIVDRLEASRR